MKDDENRTPDQTPPEGADKGTEKDKQGKVEGGDKLTLSQSELDSLISKSVAKAIGNKEKAVEKAKLEAANDFKTLLEQERAEKQTLLLKIAASAKVNQMGLPSEMAEDLISLGSEEKIDAFLSKFASVVEKKADETVKGKLKTTAPPSSGSQPPASPFSSLEEYTKWRSGR
jgi:hypothetical protein